MTARTSTDQRQRRPLAPPAAGPPPPGGPPAGGHGVPNPYFARMRAPSSEVT